MNDFNKNQPSRSGNLSDDSTVSNCGIATEIKRHLFISFWLWLGVVISGFVTLGYLGWFTEIGFTCLLALWLAGCVLVLSGYIMLLRWNKMGFYILSGGCFFSMVLNIIINGFTLSIFIPIINVVILYFILHIKKNGVEYWEAMDMKRYFGKKLPY